jgi:pentatricopeptide repeat protein
MDVTHSLRARPDSRAYSIAVMACGEGGMPDMCLELLEEMRARGVEPDETTYSSAIHALGTAALKLSACRRACLVSYALARV